MNQELQYLREELNQRVIVHSEQTSKAVNTILVIWSAAFTILGASSIKLTEINLEYINLYFLGATIFFISNLILYFAARQYHFYSDEIFRLGAYIAVFCEKWQKKDIKVGENFCWELVNLKIMENNEDYDNKNKKSFLKRNDEYKVLILISLIAITILSLVLFFMVKMSDIIRIILSIICVFYIVFSVILFRIVPKYTSLKDNYNMKLQHLIKFFKYSIDMGYYTEDQLKDRFGKIYETCKQFITPSKEVT